MNDAHRRSARLHAALARGIVVLVSCAIFLGVANDARAQNRAHFAEVELVGPLSDVELDLGAAGRTRIEGALTAGESRRLRVPCPSRSDAERTEPVIRFAVDDAGDALENGVRGKARFLGFVTTPSAVRSLSPGLRARPRPAVAEADVRVSRAAFVVLAIGFVLAIAVRKRPVIAVAIALVGGVGTRWLVAPPSLDAANHVTLCDGDVGTNSWLRVDAGFAEVVVPDGLADFELAVEPVGSAVVWHVPLDARGTRRATAVGARLYLSSVLEVGEASLARERNALTTFAQCWTRDDGAWSPRGTWPIGTALSEIVPATAIAAEDSQTSAPPGWLATGLPQGLGFAIAREPDRSGRPRVWWRVAGL